MNKSEIIAMAREAAARHGHTLKTEPSPETTEFIVELFNMAVAKALEVKTRDGVVVKPGDKVWVNGSVSVEQTTVQPLVAVTGYELFGPIPVARAFSTAAAARAHRYE